MCKPELALVFSKLLSVYIVLIGLYVGNSFSPLLGKCVLALSPLRRSVYEKYIRELFVVSDLCLSCIPWDRHHRRVCGTQKC